GELQKCIFSPMAIAVGIEIFATAIAIIDDEFGTKRQAFRKILQDGRLAFTTGPGEADFLRALRKQGLDGAGGGSRNKLLDLADLGRARIEDPLVGMAEQPKNTFRGDGLAGAFWAHPLADEFAQHRELGPDIAFP